MRAFKAFLNSFHFLTITVFCSLSMIFFLGWPDLPESQSLRAAKASLAGSPAISLPPAPDDFSSIIREGFLEIRGTIEKGDTLSRSFSRNNVPARASSPIYKALRKMIDFNSLRPGERYSIVVDEEGELLRCVYEINPLESYTVKYTDNGYQADRDEIFIESRKVRLSGVVASSLFAAFPTDIKTPRLIYTFADIFASRVDFNTEARAGDSFNLLVEEYYRFDEFIGYGPILAARYERANGVIFEAFRFMTKSGSYAYFDRDGNELGASFIRSPVPIGRLTSRFSWRRMHPILGVVKQHLGVDLAAPQGTPVMAAADGRIVAMGNNGGFGKQIIIAHGSDYRTHYGHLAGYRKGLKIGNIVTQKQIIGYVGSTGLATGPHLDYRIQHHGVFQNPFSVKFNPKSTLQGEQLAMLRHTIVPLIPELSAKQNNMILKTTALTVSEDFQITML